MQYLEEQLLLHSPCEAHLWKRYVDDCLAIIPTDQIPAFSTYVNTIHTNIQFTHETEVEEKLPYLDLILHR